MVPLTEMNSHKDLHHRLVCTLRGLKRQRQYLGLKRYVYKLKRKECLNGKERFVLKGSLAYLKRLQVDRRSLALGLKEFRAYDERKDTIPEGIRQSDYKAWLRTVETFYHGR